jgi:hypothetical protein
MEGRHGKEGARKEGRGQAHVKGRHAGKEEGAHNKEGVLTDGGKGCTHDNREGT